MQMIFIEKKKLVSIEEVLQVQLEKCILKVTSETKESLEKLASLSTEFTFYFKIEDV